MATGASRTAGRDGRRGFPSQIHEGPSFQPKNYYAREFHQLGASSEISHEAVKLGHLYSSGCRVSGDVILFLKLPSFEILFWGFGPHSAVLRNFSELCAQI